MGTCAEKNGAGLKTMGGPDGVEGGKRFPIFETRRLNEGAQGGWRDELITSYKLEKNSIFSFSFDEGGRGEARDVLTE